MERPARLFVFVQCGNSLVGGETRVRGKRVLSCCVRTTDNDGSVSERGRFGGGSGGQQVEPVKQEKI